MKSCMGNVSGSPLEMVVNVGVGSSMGGRHCLDVLHTYNVFCLFGVQHRISQFVLTAGG